MQLPSWLRRRVTRHLDHRTGRKHRPRLEALEDRDVPSTVSFSAPVSYSVGTDGTADGATLGDFNGDGRPDLVVSNGHSDFISVLLGNGDGTFQPAQNCVVGFFPGPIAVGDFNGDGQLDLAVSHFGGSPSVLLGHGDGTFTAGQDIAVGGLPVVGDFNGDGKPDLAVASPTQSTVNMFLGNGDGTFQAASSSGVGPVNFAPVAGDINGDGNLDIVAGSGVLLGNGDGTFQTIHSLGGVVFANSVVLQDLNGDGKLDLAFVSTFPSGIIEVMPGNGDGTFQPAQSYSVGSSSGSLAVGDVNGDGKPDLLSVTTRFPSSSVNVLLGNGNGAFQPVQSYSVSSFAPSAAVGDLNGDGRADLAVPDGNVVNVLLSAFATTTSVAGPSGWTYGQPAIFTATLTSTAGSVAGGTVTFMDGNTPVSPALPLDANGHASFNMAMLNAGNHSISALYSGSSPAGAGVTPFGPSSAATSVNVSPAPLSAIAVNFGATAGTPFNGAVASFVNADPFGGAASYRAFMDWGDGTALTACTITGTGTLTVGGSHTYADPGSYAAAVHISHLLGNTTSATVYPTATVSSLGQPVQHGLAADVGLWHNKNGQALINSFNGGSDSTALSNWLATNFPNLYEFMYGATNADVAAMYQGEFALPGSLDAQVLATALDIYATTASLGGTAGQAYGFTVTATGLGADSFNVGADGAAFGVANNSTRNVFELLKAVDALATDGVLYGGDTTLRNEATDLFAALFKAGSL